MGKLTKILMGGVGVVVLLSTIMFWENVLFNGLSQIREKRDYKINREKVINSIMEKYDLDKNGSLDKYELRNYLSDEFK